MNPVTDRALQELILGPVLFYIFFNDPDNEVECAPGKFTDYKKPRVMGLIHQRVMLGDIAEWRKVMAGASYS